MSGCFGPPIDLSFLDAGPSMEDLVDRKPRRGVQPYLRSTNGRYHCSALRLNNNRFTTTRMLPAVCSQFLEHPEALAWLDLSCNRLRETPSELVLLPGLRLLYLHGNRLTALKPLLTVLSALPELFGLTLHGNLLPEYRYEVLSELPRLRALDFSNVTHTDRYHAAKALAKQPVMWRVV
jgi:Leucine-rich repeat (LRR) protein